jgi:hypothetical protein
MSAVTIPRPALAVSLVVAASLIAGGWRTLGRSARPGGPAAIRGGPAGPARKLPHR